MSNPFVFKISRWQRHIPHPMLPLNVLARPSPRNRQQRGWQVAQQAAQLLKGQFSVQKVVLFGSLLDARRLRSHSDIDLAVWGLAEPNYYSAVTQLLDLNADFSIDLVQFEAATPALRQSILTTGIEIDQVSFPIFSVTPCPPMTQYAPLIGLIQQNLDELAQLTEASQRLLDKFQQTQDEDYLGTLAFDLHSFYTGAERIFREIAHTVEGNVPDSADWHRRLLRQMSAEIPGIRPAVIRQATRQHLDDYCAFRHVVRNIYTFNLRADRIQQLTAALPSCFEYLKQDCDQFCQHILAAGG